MLAIRFSQREILYSGWNGIARISEQNSKSENTQTTGVGHGGRIDMGNTLTKPEEEVCLFNKTKD